MSFTDSLSRWETMLLAMRDDVVDEQEVVEALRKAVRTTWGKWIAARAGVSPAFISNVLAGRSRPSPALARALGYERLGPEKSQTRVYRKVR